MGIIHKLTFIPRFVRQLFFKWLNPVMFQSAGANIGKGFNVKNRVYLKLYKNAKLNIGNNFSIESGDAINPISRNIKACIFVDNGASLTIGNRVGMSGSTIWRRDRIDIGNNVKIGACCTILDNDCHSLNYIHRCTKGEDYPNTKHRPVIIEDDVLIGAHSIILKGTHIGARSIIGAGSVVSGDIPADCIAAGNPCKVIKTLITENE